MGLLVGVLLLLPLLLIFANYVVWSIALLYVWIVHPSGTPTHTHARNKQTNKQKSEKHLVLESRI